MSSGGDSPKNRAKVDAVFAEAVRRGIILRKGDTMDVIGSEYDLSGMSLPVARVAVRFLLNRIASSSKSAEPKDLTFITGVGSAKSVGKGSTTLREYVQDILSNEFDPSIPSTVPRLAKGTVEITADSIAEWIKQQK